MPAEGSFFPCGLSGHIISPEILSHDFRPTISPMPAGCWGGSFLEGLAEIRGERVVAACPFVFQVARVVNRSTMRAGGDSGGFADVEACMTPTFDVVTDLGFLDDMHGLLHTPINRPSMTIRSLTRAEEVVHQYNPSDGSGFPRGIQAAA
jgi:hypothetical protein